MPRERIDVFVRDPYDRMFEPDMDGVIFGSNSCGVTRLALNVECTQDEGWAAELLDWYGCVGELLLVMNRTPGDGMEIAGAIAWAYEETSMPLYRWDRAMASFEVIGALAGDGEAPWMERMGELREELQRTGWRSFAVREIRLCRA